MGGAKHLLKKVVSFKFIKGMGAKAKAPPVITTDPEKEAEKAANKAAEEANLEIAQKKKARRASSLLSTGGEKGNIKQTLGG